MTDPIKLGALIWNQYTDWPAMRAAGVRADELGYSDLWTWDHCIFSRNGKDEAMP